MRSDMLETVGSVSDAVLVILKHPGGSGVYVCEYRAAACHQLKR